MCTSYTWSHLDRSSCLLCRTLMSCWHWPPPAPGHSHSHQELDTNSFTIWYKLILAWTWGWRPAVWWCLQVQIWEIVHCSYLFSPDSIFFHKFNFQSRYCHTIFWSKVSGWENVQLASNLTVCTWCWLLHGGTGPGWTTPVGVGCYIPTNIVIVVTRVVPVVTRIDWNIHRIVMTMCSLIWTAEMFPVKLLRIFAILSLDNGE